MPGVIVLAPAAVYADPNQTPILSNATVSGNDSAVIAGYGNKQITLIVNVSHAPTGGVPTLTVTLQEVDPGDNATPFGPVVSTGALSAAGITTLSLAATIGGTVKVSWAVGGSDPTFTGVYITLSEKTDGPLVVRTPSGSDVPIVADAAGHLVVANSKTVSSSAATTVASSASNVTLFTSNPARAGATVYNQSTTNLYLKLGSGAALNSASVVVRPNAYYEVPYTYLGQIDGIWDVVDPTGKALLTELADA